MGGVTEPLLVIALLVVWEPLGMVVLLVTVLLVTVLLVVLEPLGSEGRGWSDEGQHGHSCQ